MNPAPRRDLFVFYGLPGSGKTSLGRFMAANLPNFFYSEIASHPDYGHQPMMRCAVDLYKQGGMGKNLITEAVLEDPEARNRFAHHLYLQVEVDNPGAQALYRGMGFSESHRYHYRASTPA